MENEHMIAAHGIIKLDVPRKDDQRQEQSKTITSSIDNIADLQWQLELCRGTEEDNHLKQQYQLYVKWNEKCTDEHFWFCQAKFTVYSKEEGEDQRTIIETDPMTACYGFSSMLIAFIYLTKIRRITITVEVDILHLQSKMFALDTNIEVKLANGVTEIVAVNKNGLACLSNFFHNFFFLQWKEKGLEKFIIREEESDFDIGTFRLMIYGALSMGCMVPEFLESFKEGSQSRMFDILMMSFYYHIPPLVEYCEHQLILNEDGKYPPNMGMLELADQLNLTKLKNHCLANIGPMEFTKDIAENIEIRSRLEKRTREELDNVLQQEYWNKMKCSSSQSVRGVGDVHSPSMEFGRGANQTPFPGRNPDSLKALHCELENWETWQVEWRAENGRMFPVLRVCLYGTRPGFLYHFYLDIVPVEGNHRFRYAYSKSQWQSAGKADNSPFGRLFLHPDSPFTAEQLAHPNHVVSFDKAKLTNHSDIDNYDQFMLNSMHKYRPRIHVFCLPKGHPMEMNAPSEFRTKADLDRLAVSLEYKTFTFPKTTFVAVTAYQNQLVTQKKIELNPFAKGFRDHQQMLDGTTTPMAATAGAAGNPISHNASCNRKYT